jgi:hypothetical protein
MQLRVTVVPALSRRKSKSIIILAAALQAAIAAAQCPPQDSVSANPPAGAVFVTDFSDGNAASVRDYSGWGNHGAYTGNPLWYKYNSAYVLRSLDATYNHVVISDAPSLNFGSNSFSVVVWTRADEYNGYYTRYINKGDAVGTPSAYGWGISDRDVYSGSRWNICAIGGTEILGAQGVTWPTIYQNWHHIVMVVDRAAGELRSYCNGDLVATSDISAYAGDTSDTSRAMTLFIAYRHTDGAQLEPAQDNTYMSSALVFNRALSPDEIRELYQRGKSEGK